MNQYTAKQDAKIAVHSTHPRKMQKIPTGKTQKVQGKTPKLSQNK